MAQADIDAGRKNGLSSSERKELACLRKENRVLAMENEMKTHERLSRVFGLQGGCASLGCVAGARHGFQGGHCQCSCSGWFDSPLAAVWTTDPVTSARIADHTAARRWGASDLPGAYLFLASEPSSYITGTTISVDGGDLTK